MMRLRNEHVIIFLILMAGAILRLWGLDFGLPYTLHQDEPIVVNHAMAYGTGDLNPHFFIIPPLCSYIVFLCYGVYFLLGKAVGIFPNASSFAYGFFNDPTAFYLIARVALGIIPGILSIYLVYRLYKRLCPGEGAWYASAVMAVSFLAVVNAHYAYVDNMMVFFILLVYLSLLRMMDDPSVWNYLISGLLSGAAVAVKYNAALLAVSFIAAHIMIVAERGLPKRKIVLEPRLWGAVIAALAAFILLNPFAVIDWRSFLYSVPGKIRHRYMGWTHHLVYSLRAGAGEGLLSLGIAGGTLLAFKEKRGRGILFASFPLIFYLHLVAGSQRFSRYVLPLIPFVAVGAAYFFFGFVMPNLRTRWKRRIVVLLALLLLVPTFTRSIKADRLFAGEDTRALSTSWIEKNVPAGSVIAVDHTAFRPMISQTPEQILSQKASARIEEDLSDVKYRKIEYMAESAKRKKSYNVYFMTYKGTKKVQFLSQTPVIGFDMEDLYREGIEYVVVNYNSYSDDTRIFIGELEKNADIVAVISPYHNGAVVPSSDMVDQTYISISSEELFSRKYEGPCLVVYKLRKGTGR